MVRLLPKVLKAMSMTVLLPLRAVSTLLGQGGRIVPLVVANVSLFRVMPTLFEGGEDKSNEWFTIMLPARFSRRLERQLFL